jgi:stalled ribosome alternative rescue factor ArfA
MAKKKKKTPKRRNPEAITLQDPLFRQRVEPKKRPKDYKPEVDDDWV